ncbi:MAG: hypothetical protein SFU99_10980 [Saprospiraceae bacterium]|nr:hypothetical protein [Saprospiraceae bacterium]
MMDSRSNSEVGHAKNVANFEQLRLRCIGFGMPYNPSRPELQIDSLQNKLMEARMCLDVVIEKNTAESNATNHRRILFEKLPFLTTRIVNAFAICGVHAEKLADAKGIQRKIQGRRAGKKEDAETTTPEVTLLEAETETPEANGNGKKSKSRSSSQQSFDLKIEHVARMISLLQSEPKYMPNEQELQVASLQMLLQEMRSANTAAMQASMEAEAARRHRKLVMYHKETGLVAIAKQVKMYVKSVFGATSQEYKEVRRFSFRVIR